MLFNSSEFFVFFPLVTLFYFATPHRARPYVLLAASVIFYMVFIPVYILILAFTILLDYAAGLAIGASQGKARRFWLIASIVSNLGVLAVFKYFDFFSANATALAASLGSGWRAPMLDLILPLGLSFHTFQSMSYTIEVYRGNQPVERNLGLFALYVLFYPQLVAGPIERPQNLLPQFREKHEFRYDDAAEGLRLMAWGFFKKIFVADRLGLLVDPVYANPTQFEGLPLIVATLAFSFQIYCDFSGYSDIARGAARVMGFRLMLNFDRPYLARSIPEFWRRWHVSLSTWFRDYLYIPLGGNRASFARQGVSIGIVFLLSGLWHGANWTFLIWGALHAVFFIAFLAWGRRGPVPAGAEARPVRFRWLGVTGTFLLVTLAWVFFRAGSLSDAGHILSHFHSGLGKASTAEQLARISGAAEYWGNLRWAAIGVLILMGVEAAQRGREVPQLIATRPGWARWAAYYAVVLLVLVGGVFRQSPFIYFQF